MAGRVRAIALGRWGGGWPGHARIGVKIAGRRHDGCHPVMARLVRAIATRTCRDRWPGRALGRTHISEIIWMINTLTARAERSPAVMAGLSGPSVAAQMA